MNKQKTENELSPYAIFFSKLNGFNFFYKEERVYRYQLFASGFTDTVKALNNGYKNLIAVEKTK